MTLLRIGSKLVGPLNNSLRIRSFSSVRKLNLTNQVLNNNNNNATLSRHHRVLSTSAVLTQKPQTTTSEQTSENFLNGSSATYIEEIYQAWLVDPKSVHKSWDIYFKTNSVQAPPTLGQLQQTTSVSASTLNHLVKLLQQTSPVSALDHQSHYQMTPSDATGDEKLVEDHLKLYALIRSYQIRGHKKAQLDPLDISRSLDVTNEKINDLSPEFYNFTEEDLNREFRLPATTFIGGDQQKLTLREILNRLNSVYSKTIGLEYMYINNFDKCNWIRQQFETPGAAVLTNDEKKRGLKRLIRATRFEEFLAKKWSSEKRFGLEGCEVLIPAMKTVIDTVSAKGVDTVIMGMPHRGRLNVIRINNLF
jgi:2-oxoglutarate dehydrogenase E1 component